MKYYYDLHIHSCLSPCGDADMTPHSIAGMSYINGLDIIAVADHNTAKNIRAVTKAAEEFKITVIPAIEAETAEGIHMLCLFPDIASAENMGELLQAHLPPIKNRPDIFGRQVIMNELDEETGEIQTLLINSTDLPIEAVKTETEKRGGVCIAAHIDRESNGINAILGSIPDELNFTALELSNSAGGDYPKDKKYIYIKNSDAHYLQNISEKVNFIELAEKNADCLLKKLRNS